MRIWGLLPAFGALGFCALASGLWAADQIPAPAKPADVSKVDPGDTTARIILDVTRVNMLFTVTDKKGRFITDLVKNDFQIVEGKHEQVIQEFAAESDLPLRLGVLIDTSNSIRDRIKFEQEAAISFITSVVHAGQDRALIVTFDTTATLAADLIDDTEKLSKIVRDLRPGGGTSLYDAIYFACRDKLAQDQPRHKFRRAIVIVSDGDDNQSTMTRDQALEMAQKADVVIYAISTNITRIETDGDKVLRYLTAETGGRAFFPFKVEDLDQSFENIANELRHQYNIFYRPEPLKADGLYHTVDLHVRGRKDLVVRCRKGYYAPKM
jgi:VWFA-related protein